VCGAEGGEGDSRESDIWTSAWTDERKDSTVLIIWKEML